MKILMVGNVASVNQHLTTELRTRGHDVFFVADKKSFKLISQPDCNLFYKHAFKKAYGNAFDIIHINNPNLLKLLITFRYVLDKTPVVFHWRGSDLRREMKRFRVPVNKICKKIGSYHLYSTPDLHYWLYDIPKDKKMLFRSCVDTETFKPNNTN